MPFPCLVINVGSSSIKFAFFVEKQVPSLVVQGSVERIGFPKTVFSAFSPNGDLRVTEILSTRTHEEALFFLFDWLEKEGTFPSINTIAHRIVQGGPHYCAPTPLTSGVMQALEAFAPYDPEHLPQQIKIIHVCQKRYPQHLQIACFDTYFHRHLPPVAKRLPIPRHYHDKGVVRYGFHGISYEWILHTLQHDHPKEAIEKIIIAHLGNGASMAAVYEGKGIDTTMGFSPTGGLVMSSRTGDLDPGVLLYAQEQGEDLRTFVNEKSGLLGVSGITSDMKDLLAKEEESLAAKEAIDLFCYQAKKHFGALYAVLGGVDTLVFTGGIGEHSSEIRERICHDLAFCGIAIDKAKNQEQAAIISTANSDVKVRIIQANEEAMMALHVYLLRN